MGHNRLPRLPNSRGWQEVVELLSASAAVPEILARSAEAAQKSFKVAVDDPVVVEAVRILIVLTLAGREEAFAPALRREGLDLGSTETLHDLLDAVSRRLDQVDRSSSRAADLGELARRSVLGTLHAALLDRMPGLFGEQPGDLANAVKQFSGPRGFSALARGFFTQMTSEIMAYWLERTLGAHVEDPVRRDAFDAALGQFSSEATRIIQEFSSGWFAKNALNADDQPVSPPTGYAAVAFRKINDEMSRKTGIDA